jgi:anti-sigma factor RsiW
MPGDEPISEDELHAYVDGDIALSRRLDIALYLARHPAEAARMEVYRAQREAFHALFDEPLGQPVPPRLRSILRRHSQRRARRRQGAGMLVGIALAAIVLVMGRAIIHYAAPDQGGAAAEAAAQRAPATDELPVIRPLGPLRQHDRNFDRNFDI